MYLKILRPDRCCTLRAASRHEPPDGRREMDAGMLNWSAAGACPTKEGGLQSTMESQRRRVGMLQDLGDSLSSDATNAALRAPIFRAD